MIRFSVNKKFVVIIVLLFISIFLYLYFSVFMPIILAFITAILLEPFVKGVQKYLKLKQRLLAVTMVFTLFVITISIIFYFALTRLIKEVIKFIYQLPVYMSDISDFANGLIDNLYSIISDFPQKQLIIRELEKQIQLLSDKTYSIAQEVIPTLAAWVQGIPNLFVVTIIYLITLFLMSLELPRLVNLFYRFFKEESATKVSYVFKRLGLVFKGFFKAQFLVSIVILVVSYIGLLFITPKKALVMAIMIWIVDIIPFIGSIIILVPWSLYHIIAGNSPIGFKLLFLAAILLILRRSLEPKIMGDQIGLPALPTLLSIYFGFYFLGILGLVIGPLVVIAFISATEAGIFKIDYKI